MIASQTVEFTPSFQPFVPSEGSQFANLSAFKEFTPSSEEFSCSFSSFTPSAASQTQYYPPQEGVYLKSQLCNSFIQTGYCSYGINC